MLYDARRFCRHLLLSTSTTNTARVTSLRRRNSKKMASDGSPESTVVLRMIGDFNKFLSRPLRNNPVSLNDTVTKRLTFDESTLSFCNRGSPFASGSAWKTPNNCSDLSIVEPPSKKRQREAELISTKTQVTRLGNRVSLLETSNELAKIECDKQIEVIRLEHEEDKQKLEEMRSQLFRAIDKEGEMLGEIKCLKESIDISTAEYEDKINDLEKEKDDLKSELEEQIAQLNEAVCMLESDLHRAQMDNNELESTLKALEERSQLYETNSVSLTTYTQEMERANEELKKAQRKICDLEVELSKLEDAGTLVKILQGQLVDKEELEKENRRLKERNALLSKRDENIMLLNEKLESSKQAIERLEKQAHAMQNCQLENEDLHRRLSVWENLSIIGVDLPKSPHNVTKAISELQQKNMLLLQQTGDLTSNYNAVKRTKQMLEEEVGKLNSSVQLGQITLKQNSDQIRHLQRKLLLVSKERDISREMLDSYTKEATLVVTPQGIERIRQLEVIVDGYKRTVEKLELELQSVREELKKIGFQSGTEVEEERERMASEIKLLKATVAESEGRIIQLEEQRKDLELRIEYGTLKGEINPLKTRAIHLSSNPVAWARQQRAGELEQVKKENLSLRQRLKVLEEVGESVENLTMTVEERLKEGPPAKVLEDLQKQLVAVEGKNKRLMEEFKKISSEFREVTYTLLGYNISLPCSGQFKLSNMYAESPNDYLLFAKAIDTGELQLLETPFSSAVSDKIELYLHTHRSIPAFLSNLTLELFNSQTGIFSASTCILDPNTNSTLK